MCCCHPYMPNADGTACMEHNGKQRFLPRQYVKAYTEPECENWSEWNDWSDECVWLPPSQMRETYAVRCSAN